MAASHERRPPLAHDVFISYTTRDKAIADAVCHALEAQRIRCWIAPRDLDLHAGVSWKAGIVAAIRSSQVMVLIFSGEVNTSSAVRQEVDIAFEQRRPIVPFRIENVAPSDELLFCIAGRHWLDALTAPVEQHIDRLVSALRRFIVEPEPAPAPVMAPEPEPVAVLEPEPVALVEPEPLVEREAEYVPIEERAGRTPLMGAMTPARIAIAAAGIVAVIALGVWSGKSPDAPPPPKTGIDFYDAGEFAEAIPLLTQEADTGSVDAQARLAEAYLDGRGVTKDITLGLSFLTRAANGGNLTAQSRLGSLYETGTGVSRDLREAMRWHARAADKGVVPSQCASALLAVNGEGGVARDYDAAAKWYGAAAKSGAPCGQLGYGYLLYHGYGVAKNYDEAVRLWEAAEAQGDATAKDNIAKVQADWALPPLFPGAWSAVIGEERRAEIQRIKATSIGSALGGAIVQRVRKLPVDFYEGGAVYEVEIASGAQQPGVLSYVRVRDMVVPVNGKADQLAELNGNAPIRLDTQPRALQAMRFLISSVQGDQGPFRLMDQIRPFEVSGNPAEGWIGKGAVQIGTNLFELQFSLKPDGALNMTGGQGLTQTTAPIEPERFDEKGLRRRVRGD